MTDIVRVLESYATSKGWQYHYGRKACLNLLSAKGENNTIYFLHDFRKGEKTENNKKRYTGSFFLVVEADFDQKFFNEVSNATVGKYEGNIEPLISLASTMLDKDFFCTDIDVIRWDFIDVTDALDTNFDGILIRYTIDIPSHYEL